MTEKAKWIMPHWMEQYREMFVNCGGVPIEELMNEEPLLRKDGPDRDRDQMIFAAECQVGILANLYEQSKLEPMEAPLKLETLIKKLKALPATASMHVQAKGPCVVDLESWRGRYDELSIDSFSVPEKPSVVGELLKQCEEALEGKKFNGYKGGSFVMSASTPVWADTHGDCEGNAVYDVVLDEKGNAVIRTIIIND